MVVVTGHQATCAARQSFLACQKLRGQKPTQIKRVFLKGKTIVSAKQILLGKTVVFQGYCSIRPSAVWITAWAIGIAARS